MKSEPRGKSTARDLAYIHYINDGLDFEIQMNYLIDFSWQIFDENLYVMATGDVFPISMLKDAVGDTAKINITRYYKTPVSSIPEAEIPPSELIPGIIEETNKLAKGYGIEITNARFNDFSVSEADRYIKAYLSKYSGVDRYMNETVTEAKKKGYVTTLKGRRRYIPELSASNKNVQAVGKRMAMNTPIQGTAADIMKIAMINLYNELKNRKLNSFFSAV